MEIKLNLFFFLLVFVPPHQLIKYWVSVLRNEETPSPIFSSGIAAFQIEMAFAHCMRRPVEILCKRMNAPVHSGLGYSTMASKGASFTEFGENRGAFSWNCANAYCSHRISFRQYSTEVSASEQMSLIWQLRERTSAPIKELKSAPVDSYLDLESAQKELRKRGMVLAGKKASETAAEGLLALAQNERKAAVIQLNCETDFIARNENFQYLELKMNFEHRKLSGEKTVETAITEVAAITGENVKLRRGFAMSAPAYGVMSAYLHTSSQPGSTHRKFQSRENSKSNQELYRESARSILLNSQIVHKTLVDCRSDLVALSFFLWCARQPNYFHDRVALGHMVPVASRLTQRFSTVRGIIEELALMGCVTKPQTLLLLLRIFWCGGLYELVFEAYEEMLRCGFTPNTFARNVMVDVLFRIGNVDLALRVLEETEVPNFLSFSIAVCNLCKLNDLVNMRSVLRSMMRNGYYLNPDTFLLVLNCYCKLFMLEEALQLLSLMMTLGVSTSVNVWTMLIDGFCKSGQLDIASYLLDKMVKSGCSPNIVTCTSLIKGFLESKMPNKAFKILSTMESKGCYPDLFLCNVLIDGLSKMGRYDEALDFFFNLQKRGLIPDPYTFCSILSTICSSREFLLLPLLISGLVIEPDIVMCNSLLNYFCKAGYPSGAIDFYNNMIDRGFQPDKYSYAGLLSGLCKSGRIHEAVDVYNGIVQNHLGLDAHVHTIIIDGLIKTGNFHSAIKFFRKAATQNFPLDVVSFTVAINGLLKGGRAGEAYNLFVQMKDIGITPNIYTYNLMLSGFCKDKDVRMIKEVLQEMSDVGVLMDNNTFDLIKSFLYKWHNNRSVFELFVQLWDCGLLPKEMCALLINELGHDAVADNAHTNNMEKVADAGIVSSDEICGLAAFGG